MTELPPGPSVGAGARAVPRVQPVGERARAVASRRGLRDLVGDVVAAAPDATAVVGDDGDLSYRALARHVDATRAALTAAGCGPGNLVAVTGRRGPALVVALLAVESLGAVYLPVDPQWPAARAAGVLARAGPHAVLTAHRGAPVPQVSAGPRASRRPAAEVRAAAQRVAGRTRVPPDEPRYVIFTSGSTGVPKGAVVTHLGLTNHLAGLVDRLALAPGDRVGFTAPTGFVISVWQQVAALLVGGTVVVADDGDLATGSGLASFVARHRVTVLELVPLLLRALVGGPGRATDALPSLRCVLSTGEPLPVGLAGRVRRAFPDAALVNAYGCAECADDVTLHLVGPADLERDLIPIGTPVLDTALYVLVREGAGWRDAVDGETGELWVGGAPVGLGYLDDAGLTARSFTVDTLDPRSSSGRLYRTGDLVRREGGRLYCLGRRDRQVKIAGVRLEPAEVEAALLRIPGVRRVAVVRAERLGEGELVAHYEAAEPLPVPRLLAAAGELLPAAMVPRRWRHVAGLPMTPNGKVDYPLLAAVGRSAGQE